LKALSRLTTAVVGCLAVAHCFAQSEVQSVDKVAAELANPLAPVTTLSASFRSEFGNGPNDDTNYTLRLQPSFFKPLQGNSAALLRTVLPLRSLSWPENVTGVGDLTLVPYYVPDVTKSLFVGYGAALGIPTASNDLLGSGKWTAGPAIIVAKTGQPVTWGGLAQQVWSVAGSSDRANVSVTTVQPFITYLLGGGWSTTVTSETSYNWEAQAGQQWTVPLLASASKVVDFGGQYVNFGVAYVRYVEKPTYAPDWELRFSVTYVVR